MARYGDWKFVEKRKCHVCRTGMVTVEKREVSVLLSPVYYDPEYRERSGQDVAARCDHCDFSDYDPADLTD